MYLLFTKKWLLVDFFMLNRILSHHDFKTPIREFAGAKWTALVRYNADCNQRGEKYHKPVGVWVGVDHPLNLPVGWSKLVGFQFELVNIADETKNIKSAHHGMLY